MITKERLEALIKQGAIVYCFTFDEVFEEKLGPNHFVDWELDNMFLSKWDEDTHEPICEDTHEPICDIYYIFEHKEEAEHFQWSFEFGCIERAERLVLPTWEEVNQICLSIITFINKDGKECNLVVEVFENRITVNGVGGAYDIWELTKENYTLACRKCKELFLGENK